MENQPKSCKFNEMKDYQEFEKFEDGENKANERHILLKPCAKCFKQ